MSGYTASDFGPGKSGPQIVWLRERLLKHGHVVVPTWSEGDRAAVAAFQRAQGWSGSGADGLPGRLTLQRLAADPATAPSIDLSGWKWTAPYGDPDEIFPIGDFENAPWFDRRTDGIAFRAAAGGSHTSGSRYPRSELRQMNRDGSRAAWSNKSEAHTMTITQAVTAAPAGKAVVCGQIHDSLDDVVRVVYKNGRLYATFSLGKGKDTEPQILDANYRLGTRFGLQIVADAVGVNVLYNGVKKAEHDRVFTGGYFKAGAYVLSDDPNDGYGEVVIYAVEAA